LHIIRRHENWEDVELGVKKRELLDLKVLLSFRNKKIGVSQASVMLEDVLQAFFVPGKTGLQGSILSELVFIFTILFKLFLQEFSFLIEFL
jgi:hypothetical protein